MIKLLFFFTIAAWPPKTSIIFKIKNRSLFVRVCFRKSMNWFFKSALRLVEKRFLIIVGGTFLSYIIFIWI